MWEEMKEIENLKITEDNQANLTFGKTSKIAKTFAMLIKK